jgi:hypothetical protein
MPKVKVVVAMRTVDNRLKVAGMWEAVWAVNKQLVDSPMGAASE